jgi:hypothetical protein
MTSKNLLNFKYWGKFSNGANKCRQKILTEEKILALQMASDL